MKKKTLTYKDSGVDYDAMDPFKRLAQLAALRTARNIQRLGFSDVGMSRGESVYLVEGKDYYLAQVEEGLGSKNLVADEMYYLAGKSYYDQIAQDTVAMIVNDMITLGALPLSVAMHLAVGNSNWFNNKKRSQDLISGWQKACFLARCVWGCGETPTLKGIVSPGTAVLSGSAMGIIEPKERLIKINIEDGDAIVFIESSGIHANGLTMARKIAEKLSSGYLTKLDDGRTYGETLLDPTHIYVGLIEECLDNNVNIHYAVNVTGHGWRKLMRATQPFSYIIERLPKQLPIFDFLQKYGPIDDKEAYGNFNMGVGFALYVSKSDVEKIIGIAESLNLNAFAAGYIKKSDEKKVIINPKNIEFLGSSLGVR